VDLPSLLRLLLLLLLLLPLHLYLVLDSIWTVQIVV